jgi:acyl dehydratase
MVRYFEDFAVGEQFESPGRTITETHHTMFAGIAGNLGSIHLDAEKMEESDFDGRLVYGLLVVAMMEGLRMWSEIGPDLEENAIAHYGIDDLRFVEPVYIGDTIHNEMEVLDLEERDDDSGVLVLEEKAVNQDEETVVVLKSKLLTKRA